MKVKDMLSSPPVKTEIFRNLRNHFFDTFGLMDLSVTQLAINKPNEISDRRYDNSPLVDTSLNKNLTVYVTALDSRPFEGVAFAATLAQLVCPAIQHHQDKAHEATPAVEEGWLLLPICNSVKSSPDHEFDSAFFH